MHGFVFFNPMTFPEDSLLECSMIVHRRCRLKVGNYCGSRGNTLELYEQWKEKVEISLEYFREKKRFCF